MKKIIQSPSWDRIVTILKNETLCVNELARRIGLERPHMIEAAKDPATGICPELAARIHYAFPAYSVEWLRTGLGPHPATREEAHPQAEVSLSGRWALLRTEHYWSDGRRPGSWLPDEVFEPGSVVWDFGADGLLDRYESYLKVATVPYAFDRPHGWLRAKKMKTLRPQRELRRAGLPAFRSSEIRTYGASVPVRPDGQRISFRPLRSVRVRSPWR